MSDKDLMALAKSDPDDLARMILSETERQGDAEMSDQQLLESQQWVARAEAARELSKRDVPAQDGFHSPEDNR